MVNVEKGQYYSTESITIFITDVAKYRAWFQIINSGICRGWDFDVELSDFQKAIENKEAVLIYV